MAEILSAHGVSAREALEFYREGLRRKEAERLAAAFPKVETLLGEGAFLALSQAHARACPRHERSMENLVRRFPVFLAGYEVRADLADLAALDLARKDVAEESEDAPVGADALVTLAGADWGAVRLKLVRALRLLWLRFEVTRLWESLDVGRPAPEPRASPIAVLVWRMGRTVYHSALEGHEAEALRRVQVGAVLEKVCDVFSEAGDPVEATHAALHGWFGDGIVARVEGTSAIDTLP